MMNCKKAVSMIPAYLEDDLSAKDLQAFLEHIDNCADCSEELSIQAIIGFIRVYLTEQRTQQIQQSPYEEPWPYARSLTH